MSPASMSIETLLRQQNPDGGWTYRPSPASGSAMATAAPGRSWTEATVYAVLALLASGESEASGRGIRWMTSIQRPDGGWPPQAGIDESAWVTALVALVPPEKLGAAVHARAIGWLLATYGQESSSSYRLRQWLLGNTRPADQLYPGWPWVPGAAAWVGPTSLAILALDKEFRRQPQDARAPRLQERIEAGRRFLLARMCAEGGWNHGSSRAAGYESRPYPETTGMALAALRGVVSPKVNLALETAKVFLKQCRSADALNWLSLGLMAHGQWAGKSLAEAGEATTRLEYRTLPEASLGLLVGASGKGGGFLWS